MKKVILLFGMMLIASSVFVSCTAEPLEDESITTELQGTDQGDSTNTGGNPPPKPDNGED